MSCQIRVVPLAILVLVLVSSLEANLRTRAFSSGVTTYDKQFSSRIIGGEISAVTAAPWQVSLQNPYGYVNTTRI